MLYSVLEDWLRIIFDEEVMVNACNPKTMSLIEGKLIAKRSGAYLYLTCTRLAKEINDPLQQRSAITGFLMGWLHRNAH